ncbi:hypothetical protein WJX77_000577 [Trebouxia sp. C0004]
MKFYHQSMDVPLLHLEVCGKQQQRHRRHLHDIFHIWRSRSSSAGRCFVNCWEVQIRCLNAAMLSSSTKEQTAEASNAASAIARLPTAELAVAVRV